MPTGNFRVTAWIASLAVAVFIAEIILTIISETLGHADAVPPAVVDLVFALHIGLASYVTYRLRDYLNELYEFHGVDRLIPVLVGSGILFAAVLIWTRFAASETASMVLLVGAGLLVGAISVLFGYRILGANGSIGGYKKPFAYCHILAPLCFLSVVAAPLGLLLLVVGEVLLALIYFSEDNVEFDFV
jgi:hypothetical protein